MTAELDSVALAVNLPEHGLTAGDVGAVAMSDLRGRFGTGIAFEEFRHEAQRACFRWLRAQDKPTTPPPEA